MKAAEAQVAAALAGCGLPRDEALHLLARATGLRRETLIAFPETPVAAAARRHFDDLAQRRARGEPMAYLLGTQPFCGREFIVTPDVLVPRADTETLIEAALAALQGRSDPRVLDLGTGSGCIAITLALARPDARVTAVDRSAAALAVARRNAAVLGAALDLRLGDWFEPVDDHFDLIAANPPYVAAGDPHLRELSFEPAEALVAGGDGLDDLRRIIGAAPARLRAGGTLLVEHGWDQGEAVRALFATAGFGAIATATDAGGRERVTHGRR